MIFPLKELIEYRGNMYEVTAAAARRSFQMSMLNDPEVAAHGDKAVSLAARQVFLRQIEFRLGEE
ncbi:MAG: DNA-directed RNA polymerase subunit omega [Treponematales bacterium]